MPHVQKNRLAQLLRRWTRDLKALNGLLLAMVGIGHVLITLIIIANHVGGAAR